MGDPALVSWLVFGATFVLAAVVAFAGGLATRVAGSWTDGDRRIVLHQRGPLVHGLCERPGGSELYTGFACFGWVWLRRRSFGREHLAALGFPEHVLSEVAGQVTGRLRLRRVAGALSGTFTGVRFSFSGEPARIASVRELAPTERRWQRV